MTTVAARRAAVAWLAALAGAVAACGGDGGGGAPDAPALDAAVDAAPCAPDECDWIEAYQREIVGALAGATEIAPGVTLTARSSVQEREHTRAYLAAELRRLGYEPELHAYGTGTNVLATRAGRGAARVVVGAHFDGVAAGPAAADNATGVAVVLAAARYLALAGDPDRAVVLALFDQEEAGLIGSTHYARRLIDEAVEVAAVHVFDMISYDGDGDGAVELWSPSPALEAVYRAHGEAAGIPIQPVPFRYSDHQAFLDQGFVTVGVSEEFVGGDHTPHYHEPTDTYEMIDFAYLARVTRLALTAIEATARD